MGKTKFLKESNILVQKRDEVHEGLKLFRNKVENISKLGHKQKSFLCQCTKQINSVKVKKWQFIFYNVNIINSCYF